MAMSAPPLLFAQAISVRSSSPPAVPADTSSATDAISSTSRANPLQELPKNTSEGTLLRERVSQRRPMAPAKAKSLCGSDLKGKSQSMPALRDMPHSMIGCHTYTDPKAVLNGLPAGVLCRHLWKMHRKSVKESEHVVSPPRATCLQQIKEFTFFCCRCPHCAHDTKGIGAPRLTKTDNTSTQAEEHTPSLFTLSH